MFKKGLKKQVVKFDDENDQNEVVGKGTGSTMNEEPNPSFDIRVLLFTIFKYIQFILWM
jgi:hypothetical protein